MTDRSPDAVVERCWFAHARWPKPDEKGVTTKTRLFWALDALQPGDQLPNGLEVSQGWQPIETALLEEDHLLDLWCGKYGRMPNCRPADDGEGWVDGNDDYVPAGWVTHWMPEIGPPEPPHE